MAAGFRARHGWTWLVSLAIYGGWGSLAHAAVPLPLLLALGGIVVAWHGSLQHETIHGHPSRSALVRTLVAGPPLALWLPYRVYRETHHRHHATPHLTDPAHDPESAFLSADAWPGLGPARRALAGTQRTAALFRCAANARGSKTVSNLWISVAQSAPVTLKVAYLLAAGWKRRIASCTSRRSSTGAVSSCIHVFVRSTRSGTYSRRTIRRTSGSTKTS